MKITLKCTYIIGTPGKDRKEYHAGTVIDLAKPEAERLIVLQHAVAYKPADAPDVVSAGPS